MIGRELFTGPQSLRVSGERRSLWLCLVFAPMVIGLVRLVFPSVSVSEFVLLIAAGLVFVSIARGRLLGSSIRIEGRQFPEIAELTETLAQRVGIGAPQVFVRDDPFVPIVAVGVAEPYALVISSQYYEHLRRDELAFLIARELGHIAAGHTRLTSLLSASGRENPVVALVFGAWLRKIEYTADRIGLLCCAGLGDALGAISITTFHAIGRRVDMHVLAEQRDELQSDPALRIGEWIAATPYATNRLDALQTFSASPLAAHWRARLAESQTLLASPVDVQHDVKRDECASLVRRLCASCIDLAVISAVLQSPVIVNVSDDVSNDHGKHHIAQSVLHYMPFIQVGAYSTMVILAFFVYSALLVAIGGQTLGMTVMDVRVVTTNFTKPGIVQSLWRYSIAFMTTMTSLALIGFFMRIHPHDRFSRTRLVSARKSA
jgi:Zn-dependent protease with chaperone function/uncharacterized RDD family membrane protein YckC